MSDDLSPEEIHNAVDRAVQDLLDAASVTAPPVDALALAQRHAGLKLRLDPSHSVEQQHWTAAQAIAGQHKPNVLRRLGLDPTQRHGLSAASLTNLFAERLLLPTAWFADEASSCGFDVIHLKQRFATANHEQIALRLLDLDEPCIITIVDNDHVSRRRSNSVRVNKELSPVERRCLEQVQRYSRPCRRDEDGWRVQGWPIHQADWRREILRSVLEE